MMLSVRNRYEATTPVVVHGNGLTGGTESRLWDAIKTQSELVGEAYAVDHGMRFDWLNKLTLITWNTTGTKSPLELSCERLHIPITVFGGELNVQPGDRPTYALKIHGTRQLLDAVSTEYVMAVDAFDAIMLDSPARAFDIYQSMATESMDVVYGAEKNHWPAYVDTEDAERQLSYGQPRPFMNSGCFLGPVVALKEIYDTAIQIGEQEWTQPGGRTDQAVLKKVRVSNENIVLDHHCQICQNLNGVRAGELELLYVNNAIRLEVA